jgi:outer membrane receptor protein involved in Fe transport
MVPSRSGSPPRHRAGPHALLVALAWLAHGGTCIASAAPGPEAAGAATRAVPGTGGTGATRGRPPPIEEIVIRATRRPMAEAALDRGGSVRRPEPGLDAETTTALLRGVPGLFFQQTTPGQSTPIVRGLRGSQVLHLVDGVRLNDAVFRDAPNQYLALVPTFALEAVEVLPGPAPALYGADALGGVVALRTRIPEPGEGPAWGARLEGGADTADLTRRVDGSATFRGERIAVTVGGGTRHQGSRRTAASPARLPATGYEANGAFAAARLRAAPDHTLEASAQWLHQPATPRHDELVPGFGQDAAASELFLFRPNARTQVRGGWRWADAGASGRRLSIDVARQRITDDRLTRAAGASGTRHERNESRQDALVLQLEGHGDGRPWVAGLEAYRGRVRSSAVELPDAGPARTAPARFPDGSGTRTLSVFVVPEWPLTERLALTTGLRATRFRVSVPESPGIEATEVEADELTGRLGARWEPGPGAVLFGSLSRGFRPPNVFDLGTLGPRPGNRFNRPTADLGAESLLGGELGLRLDGPRHRFEAIAFRFSYRDRIRSVATGEVTDAGREVVTSVNGGTGSYRGVELSGRLEPVPGLDLSGALTWVSAEDRFEGETTPADRIPPLHGRLRAERALARAVRGALVLDWAVAQDRLSPRDVRDPRIDPDGTDGWTRVDAIVSWEPRADLHLRLTVGNLLDEAYREHGSGLDAPGRHVALGFGWRR